MGLYRSRSTSTESHSGLLVARGAPIHAWEAENDEGNKKYVADLGRELVKKGRRRQAAMELAQTAQRHLPKRLKPKPVTRKFVCEIQPHETNEKERQK